MGHCNYHTHTYHCKHAEGGPADYCREALRQGVSVLGFSDHCPHPDGKWPTVRMDLPELDSYFAEIRQAREAFPRLVIHAGLECEYRPDLGSFQKDTFLDVPGRCEYLVLAIHDYLSPSGEWTSSWHLKDTRMYLEYAAFTVKAMASGLYRFLAHPDLFFVARGAWDENATAAARMIAEASASLGIPLEINAAGMRRPLIQDLGGEFRRPYPHPRFWEVVAGYPVKAVASSDAHKPSDVWNNTDDAEALARYYGLTLISEEELFPPCSNA